MIVGWRSNDLTSRTGSPLATFSPAGYLFAQNTQHVIYQGFTFDRGSDGHLYELYWSADSGRWRYKDLVAEAHAPLASSSPTAYTFATTGSQHVLYEGQGNDSHVHELWWDGGGWHAHDLTNAVGATPGSFTLSVPVGYEFHAEGTQHVIYQGRDRHIYELWWRNEWHSGDLTAATGAPLADSAPSAYMFDTQVTQHVVYVTEGHVHELWWDTSGWHHNDLTAVTGAPSASDEPTGYVFRAQGSQHVNYRGVDGHVHELRWDSSGWHHLDLSAATGAPAVYIGFRPSGYGFEDPRATPPATQHVVYVGVDSHIHELWWDVTGWHHNNLTAATGAPLSISNPTHWVFTQEGTQHVVYNADNHHIVELWWRPD
jgi:hypothetical protein